MSSLANAKMKSLKDKLEEEEAAKIALEKARIELEKAEEEAKKETKKKSKKITKNN